MNRLPFRLQVEELTARILPSAAPLVVPAPGPQALVQTDDHSGPGQFASADELRQYLIDQAVQQYSWCFGQTYFRFRWYYSGGPMVMLAANTVNVMEDRSASSANFSVTNTQVQGVDEGDFVETDGNYLYILANNQLVILDARHAADLKELSATDLSGSCEGEYLDGNRLTVISTEYIQSQSSDAPPGGAYWGGYQSKPVVKVTVFDVSDPGSPTVVRETQIDGTYLDSRAVGDTVYVAVSNSARLPAPQYTQGDDSYTYETEASYRARLEALPLEQLLPTVTTTVGTDSQTSAISDPSEFYRTNAAYGGTTVSLVALDVVGHDSKPIDSVTLFNASGTSLYATRDHFYFINAGLGWSGCGTHIDEFGVHDGHIRFEASGDVPGNILSRLSVSENGRYLYIATTNGWSSDASNNIYVLTARDHTLQIVGRIEGLARGETIYSVVFQGSRAFVCTFERYDPLFTIDLSDPTHPFVVGKLELPGFSGYMQMLDATHLIGIGQDQDPVTGQVEGFQVSLYDVANLSQPQLLTRYRVDAGRSSWLHGMYDLHSVTYDPDLQALTVSCAGGWEMPSAQLVFHVDLHQGALSYLGSVSDSTPISRGVFIGNILYSISQNSVQAHALSNLENLLARVQLPGYVPAPPLLYGIGIGIGIGIHIDPVPVVPIFVVTKVDAGTTTTTTGHTTTTGDTGGDDLTSGEASGTMIGSAVAKFVAHASTVVATGSGNFAAVLAGSSATTVAATPLPSQPGQPTTSFVRTSSSDSHETHAIGSSAALQGESPGGAGESTHADAALNQGGNPKGSPESAKPQQDGTSVAPTILDVPEAVGGIDFQAPSTIRDMLEAVGRVDFRSEAISVREEYDYRLWGTALAVALAPGLAELAPIGTATRESRRRRAGLRC